MKYTSPGHFRSAETFREYLQAIDNRFDCVATPSGANGPLGQPIKLAHGGLAAGNRFAVHPMEGWDGTPEGLPSEHTLRRWRRFGRSGAKLIWGGEAFAVQADGRANPNQLYWNPNVDVLAALARLRETIIEGHKEHGLSMDGLCIGLQLTHSGRYARPGGPPAPRRAAAHPILDERLGLPPNAPILTDGELEAIGESFVRAARTAHDAGFDFVDVKCCHGYLLHELLGARHRPGPHGGDFTGRTRLFRRIVAAIQSECPGLTVAVRVSIADTFPFAPSPANGEGVPLGLESQLPYTHGFGVNPDDPLAADFTEPFAFLELLQELGIRLVNISLGSPYYCPHVQRPAAYPPSDGYLPPEDPLAGVIRHLSAVRACKERFPQLILVGTGYSYLQEWLPHVAEFEVANGHVDFIGLGRMILSYPELPLDVLHGRKLARKRICRTFSDCTTAPRNGLISGCYPLDPYYKAMEIAETLKAIKKKHAVT